MPIYRIKGDRVDYRLEANGHRDAVQRYVDDPTFDMSDEVVEVTNVDTRVKKHFDVDVRTVVTISVHRD